MSTRSTSMIELIICEMYLDEFNVRVCVYACVLVCACACACVMNASRHTSKNSSRQTIYIMLTNDSTETVILKIHNDRHYDIDKLHNGKVT